MDQLITFDENTPKVDPTAFVAPSATLIGQVTLGAEASAFYGVVVRGDTNAITVGDRSNLQDNVVLHADPGFPTTIGSGVSVGHTAVVHGCTIEDDCLVGMGATIMNGAVVGTGSLVAGGAVILEGQVIPPGSLVAGVPAKVRRPLTEDEIQGVRDNASHYVELASKHKAIHG